MKTLRSEQLFAEAQQIIPGGVNSPVRAFRSVGGQPRFIERAKGARLYDVEPMAYNFLGSFAKDNELQVIERPI